MNTKSLKRPPRNYQVYKVWRRLHVYPSNNKLSKILKLLIKILFLGCASPKTKITVHFMVNIAIYESLLFEVYSCKRLQTLYTY
jgi:hypothetical protein